MSPPKKYRDWNPNQPFLFPPSPHDWLDEGDLAYFILDVVDVLDLTGVEAAIHRKDPRGTRPYDPQMMTALLLYGYCVGVMSSRKIEQATYRDVAFRVIAGGTHPDHTRISEFRREHIQTLEQLFVQTVQLAQKAGLVKLGRVGLDGTKLKASASKHKAMSYSRMLKAEAELREEIDELLELAEQTDRAEDARYGRNKRGDEVPEELRRRETRLAAIRKAKAELEDEAAKARAATLRERAEVQQRKAEVEVDPSDAKRAATRAKKARAEADGLSADHDDPDPPCEPTTELPHHRVPCTPEGKPTDKAQRNFTDPDSRIMKRDGAYLQAYNGQVVVDEKNRIIVACALTNQAPDQQHLPPLVEQVQQNCGTYPEKLLGDAGYWDQDHVAFCEDRHIEPFIATGRLKHGESMPSIRGRPPKDLDEKGRMRRKLRTKRGRAEYARRKVIPEPVFGQIRTNQRFGQLSLRSIEKTRGEWSLVCACPNLLKIFRVVGAVPA
jgi:transposase